MVIYVGTHLIHKAGHLSVMWWLVLDALNDDGTVAKVPRASIDLVYRQTLELRDYGRSQC